MRRMFNAQKWIAKTYCSVDDELGAWIPPEKWIEDTDATCFVDPSGVATFSTDTRNWTNADGAVVGDAGAEVVRRHCAVYSNSRIYALCTYLLLNLPPNIQLLSCNSFELFITLLVCIVSIGPRTGKAHEVLYRTIWYSNQQVKTWRMLNTQMTTFYYSILKCIWELLFIQRHKWS